MSFKTVEAELDNGHVHPRGAETLPAKAGALLTILSQPATETPLQAGPSLAELGRDFCGLGNGTHTDLSTNQAHLDDLGR